MAVYTSCGIYIQSATSLSAKIERIDEIITALETACLEAAANPGQSTFTEYQLDTGQNKIRTAYRSFEEMSKGILAFQRIKNMYVNQLNGHAIRLVDSKNFTR